MLIKSNNFSAKNNGNLNFKILPVSGLELETNASFIGCFLFSNEKYLFLIPSYSYIKIFPKILKQFEINGNTNFALNSFFRSNEISYYLKFRFIYFFVKGLILPQYCNFNSNLTFAFLNAINCYYKFPNFIFKYSKIAGLFFFKSNLNWVISIIPIRKHFFIKTVNIFFCISFNSFAISENPWSFPQLESSKSQLQNIALLNWKNKIVKTDGTLSLNLLNDFKKNHNFFLIIGSI